MHESGSEPTSHTIPANQTENGNNSENESGLRGSQTPPAEAPRVSHFLLHCFTLHSQFLKAALPSNSVTCFVKEHVRVISRFCQENTLRVFKLLISI